MRSLRRRQNRRKARLDSKIAPKECGRRNWKRLVCAKDRQIRKIGNEIRDLLHKQSARPARALHERRVGTVGVGTQTRIREGLDEGSKADQQLRRWVCDEVVRMIEYKPLLHGMTVERVGEALTSQTCSSCGNRHKPHGRNISAGVVSKAMEIL